MILNLPTDLILTVTGIRITETYILGGVTKYQRISETQVTDFSSHTGFNKMVY